MIIIDCKNQEQILRSMKLKLEFYGSEDVHINADDFYYKYLIISKEESDIGTVSLNIKDGNAHIVDFIVTEGNPNDDIVIDILNLLGDYCQKHLIKSLSVETTVEQSGIFKEAGFMMLESLYIVEEHVLTKMTKNFI